MNLSYKFVALVFFLPLVCKYFIETIGYVVSKHMRADQKVLQVGYKTLTYYIIYTVIFDIFSCNISAFFYRAVLCIRGTSHGPLSVCPSVTSQCSSKTAKRRITQTTPHDSAGTLVFWRQRSPQNLTGVTPCTKCRWVGQNQRLLANNRLYLENSKR